MTTRDSFGTLAQLDVSGGKLSYHDLSRLSDQDLGEVHELPYSIRVLLESVLRNQDGFYVTRRHVETLARYQPADPGGFEVPFKPARVLLQDFTGVPCLVDLAAMRSAMQRMGGDPARINPTVPVDLVIDHSVQVDRWATPDALDANSKLEFQRNRERYEFLHWGQRAFQNLQVVPPSAGICHQVNLEFLAKVVQTREVEGRTVALPDSLVGTDSHTPMVNGMGVVGWGVGGIEAEAVMLDRPLFMTAPEVVGVRLQGRLPAGSTATDLVLTVTRRLRAHGVVGRFVEFVGPGLAQLSVPDRATISNMAPEYGATMGYFPVDERTLQYMRQTGRSHDLVDLVERYTKTQGLWRSDSNEPQYQEVLELDLGEVTPCVAGPRRPQDRIPLAQVASTFTDSLSRSPDDGGFGVQDAKQDRSQDAPIDHGCVAIAAITSCTNTSNPQVMIGAGLLARKAVQRGLSVRDWVKTSLAPGSRVVTRYLDETGLTADLEALGFHTVGYGCTTCIGNSGPLPEKVDREVRQRNLVVAAVLSGNRNFEGRIHPLVKASFLASPPLVVAYALAGRVDLDLTSEPLGQDDRGEPVRLSDIWPSEEEIDQLIDTSRNPDIYGEMYRGIDGMNDIWNRIEARGSTLYPWDDGSTYIQQPPFFEDMSAEPEPIRAIEDARVLVMVGDSITTDHISPAGAIPSDSPAGRYLEQQGVHEGDFNSYGSRRGNDRVMTRGTFANIRLRNRMAPGTEGGWTTHLDSGQQVSIHEASRRYLDAQVPTIVLAGRDYGMGSSRDWAAKGTFLLGVKAVIARSYERIHRSNLVGMGVLPLQFAEGDSVESLDLTGTEVFTIGVDDHLEPGSTVAVEARGREGRTTRFHVLCRLDSAVEVSYQRHGGILQAVLRDLISSG